jgi:hypothetical protein
MEVLYFLVGAIFGFSPMLALIFNAKKDKGKKDKIQTLNKEELAEKGKINRLKELIEVRSEEIMTLEEEWMRMISLEKYVEFLIAKKNGLKKDSELTKNLDSQLGFTLDKFCSTDLIREDIKILENKINKLKIFVENLKYWIKEEEKK